MKGRHVEAPVVHHAQREVDDPDVEPAVVQVAGDRQEPKRIHLEHGRRGDHVADRSVQDGVLAEVVDARRVQQQQVGLRP
jgi:hypothetical protein